MSKYAEKNLTDGETIILKGKLSLLAILPDLFWCFITFMSAIIETAMLPEQFGSVVYSEKIIDVVATILWCLWVPVGSLPLLVKIIKLLSRCICITNKRIIGKTGVFHVLIIDYPIQKVDNISLKTGFWGTLFHYYTLVVRGGGFGRIEFDYIANATEFKNTVTKAVEQHAEEARKAQAQEIARAMGR